MPMKIQITTGGGRGVVVSPKQFDEENRQIEEEEVAAHLAIVTVSKDLGRTLCQAEKAIPLDGPNAQEPIGAIDTEGAEPLVAGGKAKPSK